MAASPNGALSAANHSGGDGNDAISVNSFMANSLISVNVGSEVGIMATITMVMVLVVAVGN